MDPADENLGDLTKDHFEEWQSWTKLGPSDG